MRESEENFLARIMEEINQASSSKNLSQLNRAINKLNKYYKKNRSQGALEHLFYAYFNKAFLCGKSSEALKYFELSQKLFKHAKLEITDPRYWSHWMDYAISFSLKGEIKEGNGEIQEALENFKKGIEIQEELHSLYPEKTEIAEDLLNDLKRLMIFASKNSLFEEAIKYNKKYLAVYSTVSNSSIKDLIYGSVYSNIGQCYVCLRDYKRGEEYLNKSLAAYQDYLNYPNSPEDTYDISIPLAQNFIHLGTVAKNSEDYKTALKHFRTAKDFLKAPSEHYSDEHIEQFNYVKMLALLSIVEVYGLMGNNRKKMKLLNRLKNRMQSDRKSMKRGDFYNLTSFVLPIFQFQSLYVEALSDLGDFSGAVELFTSYYEDILELAEAQNDSSLLLKSLNKQLEETRLDLTLKLMGSPYSKDGNQRMGQFILENYVATKEYIKENPDDLDEGKIAALESKFAQFNQG